MNYKNFSNYSADFFMPHLPAALFYYGRRGLHRFSQEIFMCEICGNDFSLMF